MTDEHPVQVPHEVKWLLTATLPAILIIAFIVFVLPHMSAAERYQPSAGELAVYQMMLVTVVGVFIAGLLVWRYVYD